MSTVYDGLNVLGAVPWVINNDILDVAQKCWEGGIVLGDIPSREDFDVPPLPDRPENQYLAADENGNVDKNSDSYKAAVAEYRSYREAMIKHRRLHQKNMVS